MISQSAVDLVPITIDKKSPHYVVYNEWNGEILYVSKKIPDSSIETFLETDNILAEKILKGAVNERDYLVAFVDDENLDIIERDEKLRLRSSEKTLHQLSRTPYVNWDIRVKIYTKNNKMLLEINPASIMKLTRLTFKKELHVSSESDLTLYLVKQNRPDFFMEKVDVDAVELLDKGNLLFDISSVVQHVNIYDLGILTRRCFKNYHVEFINDSLNVFQNTLIKNRSFVIDKALRNFPFPHLTIESTGDSIIINSEVGVSQLEEVGLLEKKLKLYVVGKNPDDFYGAILIDIEELKKNSTIELPIEADLKDVNIIHNKHRLIISIKDSPNE